jgi:sulfur-oxidizing protein SoxY
MSSANRRELLLQASLWTGLLGCGLLTPRRAWALPAAAFEATTVEGVLKALGGQPAASKDIALQVQDIVEDGAVVPVSVSSSLARTQEIFVIVEKNPSPLAAGFTLEPGTDAFVALRVKMNESALIHAVVRAEGRLFMVAKETRVTLGGCGAGAPGPQDGAGGPAPMRLRGQFKDGLTDVRVLMAHPMESGQRKDAAGKAVPAHHITDVLVRHGDRTVLTARWGPSVSRNPFLQFRLRGAKPGERLSVTWTDNRGQRRTDDALIA